MTEPNFDDLSKFLSDEGYIYPKQMPDRTVCAVFPYLYTGGLCYGLTLGGVSGRYCYEHLNHAVAALQLWDGEGDPPGDWIVKKPEGRQGPGSKIEIID